MKLSDSLWRLVSLAAAVIAGSTSAASASTVSLSAPNAAASVWDTDQSKIGVEVQIVNRGDAPAADVRITAVDVRDGALAAALSALPIVLGDIPAQRSALLDFVITVPETHTAEYLLTIAGTYRHSGSLRRFLLTRTVMPSVAPGPIKAQGGLSGTAPSQPAGPAMPLGGAGVPGFTPNATTPMLIPPGPPRQPSLPNSDDSARPTERR